MFLQTKYIVSYISTGVTWTHVPVGHIIKYTNTNKQNV